MADAFTENIGAVSDLIESGTNKSQNGGSIELEGVVSDKLDVLDLPMSDEELLALRNQWEKAYGPYETKMKRVFTRNLRSYLGLSKDGAVIDADQPGAANLQFESEETFLPAALARNPDPLVYSDNTPEGNKVADDTKIMLQYHSDQLLLKRKLSVMVRQWSIYQLSVLKPGWDERIKDVAVENRKIQDFVFDPNGYVDVYGAFSSWLGERITVTASKLIELFPKHKAYITEVVGGPEKLGTEVMYTEWWTDDFCFSTFRSKVLDKHKNEYFNYQEQEPDPLTGMVQPPKRNHFASPRKPYVFLSVFSLQERPHDITGLIEQNIPNQTKITKRTEQIDANVSQANNGILFSETNFNQETAKQASDALINGVGKVLVPQGGPLSEAVVRLQAPNLPDDAFRDLENSENHLRSSWGVQGIVSQEQKPDTTARGMILNQGRDTSRIGGGISDIVEQSVARAVFNWLLQLYMVFYDEQHFAAVMGIGKATEYVQLSAQNIDRPLIVSVAPNSMRPKDEVSVMNQAMELFGQGAIGPKVLLEAVNFPNPEESAGDGVLFRLDPMSYMKLNFPELAQQVEQLQAQAMQMQQAQVQQQQQQEAEVKGAQVGQELQHKEAAHQQKLQHGAEAHQSKLKQQTDMASARLKDVGQ